MYCRKCGSELIPDARYCSACGAQQTLSQDRRQDSRNRYEVRPDSYIWLAVLVTLLCCMPLGIVSIIYSSKVDQAWASGDYDAAAGYSRKARTWAWWGIGLSALLVVLYVVFIVILGIGAGLFASDVLPLWSI